MLEFGGVLTLNNLFNSFGGNADKLLLGKFYPASVVGLYNRAQTLMLQPLIQFMPAVQNVVLPVLSRLAQKPETLKRVFLDLLRVAAFGCSFITVYLVATSDWLVWIFLGPKWTEARNILQLLAGPAFAIPLNALLLIILTVQRRTESLLRWGLLNNSITIVAIVVGLRGGATGVAAALSIESVVILMPLLIYMAAKAGPANAKDIWSAVGPGIATCIAGSVILLFLRRQAGVANGLIGLPLLLVANLAFHALVMTISPGGKRAVLNLRSMMSSFRSAPPILAEPSEAV